MKKIIVLLSLLLFSTDCVFTYEVDIKADKTEINSKDDFVSLNVDFTGIDGDIDISELLESIKKVKGMENFDISLINQGFSFISQGIIKNGQLEEKKEGRASYTFSLIPKKTGEFDIGPFSFDKDGEKRQIDALKIKVVNENVHQENKASDLKLALNNNSTGNFLIETKEKVDEKSGINTFLIIFFLIIILGILIYFLGFGSKKQEAEFNDQEQKEDENFRENLDINSNDFLEQAEKSIKNKILEKYGIEIGNKNISEMIEQIAESEEKEKLREINLFFNKLKYSDLELDKKEFLEKIKEFLEK
ncbi:hypothetical protein BLD25_04145 [Candidatus Gracilibacteria bacterium GN02-872]|nr:hypothetical protein BLD25_04145 [Candidatus Gracilibacteria bacterium GN02-872]